MAYTITLTDGTVLTTLQDGTVNNTSTDLVLVGKNYAGYGQFFNENFVHLLENFSSSTQPNVALEGQLWWDTAGNLKVYTGSAFKTLNSITSSSSQPSGAVTGNGWWDPTSGQEQFYIYNGDDWVLIGPSFVANASIQPETITDNVAVAHDTLAVNIGGTRVGIISKDSTFVTNPSISGFSTVSPGFNLSTTLAGAGFWGTASNASALNGVGASNYARTDIAETFDNTVTINSDSGLTVGTSNNFTLSVSSGTIRMANNINNANVDIQANIAGSPNSTALRVVGSTGRVEFSNAIAVSGAIYANSGQNATSNVTGAIRVVGGIGMTGNLYTSGNINASGNIYAPYFTGVAVGALYSDLAERYVADAEYMPGTVVEIGGEKEITVCLTENSANVFGVISTDPAYLMNSSAIDTNKYAPPIAMSGRVPVRTVGPISKGERLVSAGNGCAKAADPNHVNPLAVIGRSLENKQTQEEQLIVAVVTVKS